MPEDHIAAVFAVMAATPWHTYQLLTKRHGRMRSLLGDDGFTSLVIEHWDALIEHGEEHGERVARWPGWNWYPLPNVWLGVSVENQQWAQIRVPALLDTPAAVRFLSCEPLLGPVDLARWLGLEWFESFGWGEEMFAALNNRVGPRGGLHWVIAGGESGPGARPMAPAWVRTLRDQCAAAQTAFLFKQWGAWAPTGHGTGPFTGTTRLVGDPTDEQGMRQLMCRVGKRRAGRVLDGRTHEEFPGLCTEATG